MENITVAILKRYTPTKLCLLSDLYDLGWMNIFYITMFKQVIDVDGGVMICGHFGAKDVLQSPN